MTSRYTYSIVRYVPSVVRGECMNVALIAGSDETREYDMLVLTPGNAKLRQIGGSAKVINQFLQPLQELVDDSERYYMGAANQPPSRLLSEELLGRMSQDRRSSVQLTPPLPLIADSLQAAVAMVRESFFPPLESRAWPEVTKTDVRSHVRDSLSTQELIRHRDFRENVQARAKGLSDKLDFVLSNGKPRMLIQGFSFFQMDLERVRDEVRSWAYFIGRVRAGEATLTPIADLDPVAVPQDVAVHAICAAPDRTREGLADLQEEVASIMKQADAKQWGMQDTAEVAKQAKELLSH